MNCLRRTALVAVACGLFMSLQLVAGSPFFSLYVEGGFQTEADVASSARGVGVALDASRQPLATFAARLPFAVAAQNEAAGAVLQLYDVMVSRVAAFTDRLGWAAANSSDPPTEVFGQLGTAYRQATDALAGPAANATALIASYSPVIGTQLNESRLAVLAILGDVSASLSAIRRAIDDGFQAPVTAQSVFAKLTRFQIGALAGALDALRDEATVIGGKLQEATTVLTEMDALMDSYAVCLANAFTNVNGSLTSLSSTLTRVSGDFERQLRTSQSSVTSGVQTFRTKLATFTDNVIGAGVPAVLAIVDAFSQQFDSTYAILKPNFDERLQELVDTATQTVLDEAQNLLFITNRVLDSVMRRLPTVPSQGRTCALAHISPFVQSLASNLAPALGGCVAGTGGQAEAALRGLQQTVEALVRDRLAYVKLWNDALAGVSNNSDASTRRIAYAKLSAQTSNQANDTLQPSLASSFSIFAQLTSNLAAVQNRARVCLTVKGAELSSQLGTAEANFITCLKA